MSQSTRIELARRRVKIVRVSVGVAAAAGFAVFAFAARAAHPGTHTANTDSTARASSSDDAYDDTESGSSFDGFGSSSVSPSYNSSPSVQSGGS
jgi:hypothetical protein